MADYAKLKVGLVYSENSDYSSPRLNSLLENYTSTTVTQYQQWLQGIGTSAETLDLVGFTTVEQLIVKNRDSTNYVTATWRSAGNGSTDNIVRIAAGRFLVLPDVTVANDLQLQANTAACDCEIIVVGT